MNVRQGDMARVVGTGQVNDGAIVRVVAADVWNTLLEPDYWWVVEGADLALFDPGKLWPSDVGTMAAVPDRYLRRIDPDETPVHDEQLDEVHS